MSLTREAVVAEKCECVRCVMCNTPKPKTKAQKKRARKAKSK